MFEIIPQSAGTFFDYQQKIIRDGFEFADNWLIRKAVLYNSERIDSEILSTFTFEERARIDRLINDLADKVTFHDAPDDPDEEFTLLQSEDFTLENSGYRIKKISVPGSLYPIFKAKTQREGISKSSRWILPYSFLVNGESLLVENRPTDFYHQLIENSVDENGIGFGGGLVLFQRIIAPFF